MSNQKDNRKAWMQAQRDHLKATGYRLRQAVSAGYQNAGRGLRAIARVGGGFLSASWDGRYKRVNSPAKVSPPQGLRPASTLVAAVAEGRIPQQIAANPIAFMKPSRFSMAAIPAPVTAPVFEVAVPEQTKAVESMPSASVQAPVSVEAKRATERQVDQHVAGQIEELFAKKCEGFSIRLERRIDSFCEQTSTRLDVLSEQAIQHFSDALNRQMTDALNSLMTDWAEQNRVLVDAECRTALDRFAARLEKISSSQLEGHRKEIQNLSANLKTRLRGVAHALQDLGPVSYRS